jgi:hypothetical protein
VEELVENFSEISISDPLRELESESEYNSTSSPIQPELLPSASQLALILDNIPAPPLFGHCHVSATYQAALKCLMCSGSKIMLEYSSDSDVNLDYFDSDSSEFEFDYGSDSTKAQQLAGPAQRLVITSTPEGRFVYWPVYWPEHVPADLTLDDQERFITCLGNLPVQEGAKLVDYDTDELIESTGTHLIGKFSSLMHLLRKDIVPITIFRMMCLMMNSLPTLLLMKLRRPRLHVTNAMLIVQPFFGNSQKLYLLVIFKRLWMR